MYIVIEAIVLSLITGVNARSVLVFYNRAGTVPIWLARSALIFPFMFGAIWIKGGIILEGTLPMWQTVILFVAGGFFLNSLLSYYLGPNFEEKDIVEGDNAAYNAVTIGIKYSGFFILCSILGTEERFHSSTLAEQIGSVKKSEDLATAREFGVLSEIQVSREHAKILMAKITHKWTDTPTTGVKLVFNETQLSRAEIEGRDYWVAPLANVTDRYIRLAADDVSAKPELIPTTPMKYTPWYFSRNDLQRHIFLSGYIGRWLSEPLFHVNEKGEPYWVVVRTKSASFMAGKVMHDYLIVNPFSGDITQHRLDELPEGIDVITPISLAKSWVSNWKRFSTGFFKLCLSTSGSLSEEPMEVMRVSEDGKKEIWYYFGLSNFQDECFPSGILLLNPRSRQNEFYILPVRMTTESDVSVMVGDKLALEGMSEFRLVRPMPNFEGGELNYIVTVLDKNGDFTKLAIVNWRDPRIFGFGSTIDEARKELGQRRLGLTGNTDEFKSISDVLPILEGEVLRKATIDNEYHLIMSDRRELSLIGDISSGRQLPLTDKADQVRIVFRPRADGKLEIVNIRNFTIEGEERGEEEETETEN